MGKIIDARRARYVCYVSRQESWIRDCGGDLMGYIRNYGDPGLAKCSGDGGTLIYQADTEHLNVLRRTLELLS